MMVKYTHSRQRCYASETSALTRNLYRHCKQRRDNRPRMTSTLVLMLLIATTLAMEPTNSNYYYMTVDNDVNQIIINNKLLCHTLHVCRRAITKKIKILKAWVRCWLLPCHPTGTSHKIRRMYGKDDNYEVHVILPSFTRGLFVNFRITCTKVSHFSCNSVTATYALSVRLMNGERCNKWTHGMPWNVHMSSAFAFCVHEIKSHSTHSIHFIICRNIIVRKWLSMHS